MAKIQNCDAVNKPNIATQTYGIYNKNPFVKSKEKAKANKILKHEKIKNRKHRTVEKMFQIQKTKTID